MEQKKPENFAKMFLKTLTGKAPLQAVFPTPSEKTVNAENRATGRRRHSKATRFKPYKRKSTSSSVRGSNETGRYPVPTAALPLTTCSSLVSPSSESVAPRNMFASAFDIPKSIPLEEENPAACYEAKLRLEADNRLGVAEVFNSDRQTVETAASSCSFLTTAAVGAQKSNVPEAPISSSVFQMCPADPSAGAKSCSLTVSSLSTFTVAAVASQSASSAATQDASSFDELLHAEQCFATNAPVVLRQHEKRLSVCRMSGSGLMKWLRSSFRSTPGSKAETLRGRMPLRDVGNTQNQASQERKSALRPGHIGPWDRGHKLLPLAMGNPETPAHAFDRHRGGGCDERSTSTSCSWRHAVALPDSSSHFLPAPMPACVASCSTASEQTCVELEITDSCGSCAPDEYNDVIAEDCENTMMPADDVNSPATHSQAGQRGCATHPGEAVRPNNGSPSNCIASQESTSRGEELQQSTARDLELPQWMSSDCSCQQQESAGEGCMPGDAARRRRLFACMVENFVAAERTYVQHLGDIIAGYRERCEQRQELFTENDTRTLFGNIRDVSDFAYQFLLAMEDCVGRKNSSVGDSALQRPTGVTTCPASMHPAGTSCACGRSSIADETNDHKGLCCKLASCFLDRSQGFLVYSDYCNNHDRAQKLYSSFSDDVRYQQFFEGCRLLCGLTEIPLNGFLLTPIQKLCKYPLQLAELHSSSRVCCPEAGPTDSCAQLAAAMAVMQGVVSCVNERKRVAESQQIIDEWQDTIGGWQGSDVSQRNCKLIRSGDLVREDWQASERFSDLKRLSRQKRYYHLFDTELVECEKIGGASQRNKKGFKLCARYDLAANGDTAAPSGVESWEVLDSAVLTNGCGELGKQCMAMIKSRHALLLRPVPALRGLSSLTVLCAKTAADKNEWLKAVDNLHTSATHASTNKAT